MSSTNLHAIKNQIATQRAKRALRGRRLSSVGARAVQLLLRCPHTPRLHWPSRMLASALPVEGATQAPTINDCHKIICSLPYITGNQANKYMP
ncbi:MAG: hypothetical protein HZA13_09535 [Nitrospirae bacterium]|nr:hypothetical protein [Nitrospirota bacterium]